MRTDFAQIDETVRCAVEHWRHAPASEGELERARAAAPVHVVSGFPVMDTDAFKRNRDRVVGERSERIRQFVHDRSEIERDLLQAEVVPLAVIPRVTWNNLWRGSGLYRFTPDAEGTVGVESNFFERALKIHQNLTILLFCTSIGMWPVGALYWSSVETGVLSILVHLAVTPFVGMLCLIGTVVGVTFLKGRFYMDDTFDPFLDWIGQPFDWLASRLVSKTLGLVYSWPQIMARVFPEGIDAPTSKTRFKIQLPDPPEDVKQTLWRARNFKLRTAAVPEAVSFAEGGLDGMMRKAKKDRDPIVFIEYRSAVAIVAQFGDFPIERKLVEEVIASPENLI